MTEPHHLITGGTRSRLFIGNPARVAFEELVYFVHFENYRRIKVCQVQKFRMGNMMILRLYYMMRKPAS